MYVYNTGFSGPVTYGVRIYIGSCELKYVNVARYLVPIILGFIIQIYCLHIRIHKGFAAFTLCVFCYYM